MNKLKSLLNAIHTKSVRINLGDRTYRMRLLTLSIFSLAVLFLIIAIIVLIIVNATSNQQEEIVANPAIENTALASEQPVDGEVEPGTLDDDIEPEDPEALPSDDIEPIQPPEATPTPELVSTQVPTPSPSAGFSTTLKSGDSAESVKLLQQRLVDLYYMDYPIQENGSYSVTSKYGSTTSSAVKLFQERNNLPTTGDCDPETYAKIMSNAANAYIMKQNDKCNMVKVIQTKLKEKGYIDKVTGYCGSDTITAITNFQKASGLTPDGIAGPGTLKILLGH